MLKNVTIYVFDPTLLVKRSYWPAIISDTPKSAIFKLFFSSISKLSGLMSLCTTLA